MTSSRAGREGDYPWDRGDDYYDEPYWYVNLHPQPAAPPAPLLGGGGHWHSHQWIGAVLAGTALTRIETVQLPQVSRFVESAVAAGREVLGQR